MIQLVKLDDLHEGDKVEVLLEEGVIVKGRFQNYHKHPYGFWVLVVSPTPTEVTFMRCDHIDKIKLDKYGRV